MEKFIKESVEWLKENDCGCCKYNLDGDLALFVGFVDGYDENDTTIIHSVSEPSYAIVAGIKIRNDGYYADFELLNSPWYENGEVYDSDISIQLNEDYARLARWFEQEYQTMLKEELVMS